MQPDQLQHFKQKLMREKEELQRLLKKIDRPGLRMSLEESTGELAAYDQHPGDIASELFERSKDLSLREDVKSRLNALEDALDEIERGTYGTCEVCGDNIDLERLEAVPHTTLCYRCRVEHDAPLNYESRPVEEDVLKPPFGRSFRDDTGDVMYDGEDAWQDVANWQEHVPEAEAGAYYGGYGGKDERRDDVVEIDKIPEN